MLGMPWERYWYSLGPCTAKGSTAKVFAHRGVAHAKTATRSRNRRLNMKSSMDSTKAAEGRETFFFLEGLVMDVNCSLQRKCSDVRTQACVQSGEVLPW